MSRFVTLIINPFFFVIIIQFTNLITIIILCTSTALMLPSFALNPVKSTAKWSSINSTPGIFRNRNCSCTLDWEYYFSDIVGVTRLAGELVQIELLFSPQRAKYVLMNPLHESQWHQLPEDGLFVRLKLVPNPELEQLILSFGEDVKVLQPESLATRISARAQAMVGLYKVI